jgi:hypothetical protein
MEGILMDSIQEAVMRKMRTYDSHLRVQVMEREVELERFAIAGAMLRDITLIEGPQLARMTKNGMEWQLVPIPDWRIG